MEETKLSNYLNDLLIMIPTMATIRYMPCCEAVRDMELSNLLVQLIEDFKMPLDKQFCEENPLPAYNQLRKIILKDNTLASPIKLKLLKFLDGGEVATEDFDLFAAQVTE